MAKFEVYQGKDENYYFRLKAGNGEIILSSEGYTSESACRDGIDSVKVNATTDEQYDRKESSNGKYYFNLVATNKEIIGKSEMYEASSGMENGIASVKENTPEAEVVKIEKQ
ncbi:MAG: YegP family protein [Patescibacteria group bacterium]|nr:YegP family protein [Patescibacteria group bacterium]